MYELLFTDKATKSLKKIPLVDAKRILTKLDDLAENPAEAPHVKQLTNHPVAAFRLRVGNYRILFDREDTPHIIDIVNRKNIYK